MRWVHIAILLIGSLTVVILTYLCLGPLWVLRRIRRRFTTSSAVVVLVLISTLAAIYSIPTAHSAPLFRILDVRAEYGHLVVEVQHFNLDGSHWFYELYAFQGSEQYKRPPLVVIDDAKLGKLKRQLFLADGSLAPVREGLDGKLDYYLPDEADWLRDNRTYLDQYSITSIIQKIHSKRLIAGWTKGKQRLTLYPLDYNIDDDFGARLLVQQFAGLKETAYQIGPKSTLVAYARPLSPIDPYVSEAWGTELTVYSDPHVEAGSIDGGVAHDVIVDGDTWAVMHAGAGTIVRPADNTATIKIHIRADETDTDNKKWDIFGRAILVFETQDLPEDIIIDSADLDFIINSIDVDDFADSISLDTSAPVSYDTLTAGDFDSFGDIKQAPDLLISTAVTGNNNFNTFTLNATGLSNISNSVASPFGFRATSDMDDSEPAWVASNQTEVTMASADTGLPGNQRPRLIINYTVVTAAITGTIGDGATEQEVRDGAGTIIITLTNDTWVAAGGVFDARRQDIINGITADEAEGSGWNAQVRNQLGVSSVVRTNATTVTVTLSAADVVNYQVNDNETVEVTVPNAALTLLTEDVTATPTIAITAGAESVAVTGTLSDNGTPSEIVAGGETLILTLTATKWVTAGATFNAQRQNIIDGIDSNLADERGWDAERSGLAVGNVVRTSDTIVTITLGALTDYTIPATETLTVVVPASALVFSLPRTGSPTFQIVASFQLSGNWVSPAIDPSAIADVAFSSMGWEYNQPANTSITVEASVDGGTIYSTATNGSAVPGISAGSSLAAVTDVRVKVSLVTTDPTVQPTITSLVVTIASASGDVLFYQLVAPPTAQMIDRSGYSNDSSHMSLPAMPTGYTLSVQPTEPTSDPVAIQSGTEATSEVAGASGALTNLQGGESGLSLPLYAYFAFVSDQTGVPLSAFLIMFAMVLVIFSGVGAYYGFQSVAASYIAMLIAIISMILVGSGIFPWWIFFVFAFTGASFIFYRRASL